MKNSLKKNKINYLEWLKWRDDSKKYMEEKTDELFKEVKDRNKDLQEEIKKFQAELKKTEDPTEKARLEEMISENKKQINQNNQMMAEKIREMQKAFESFGTQALSQQQFQSKTNSPNLSSFTNWGIIAFCLIAAIMLLNFLYKWLAKFLGKKD